MRGRGILYSILFGWHFRTSISANISSEFCGKMLSFFFILLPNRFGFNGFSYRIRQDLDPGLPNVWIALGFISFPYKKGLNFGFAMWQPCFSRSNGLFRLKRLRLLRRRGVDSSVLSTLDWWQWNSFPFLLRLFVSFFAASFSPFFARKKMLGMTKQQKRAKRQRERAPVWKKREQRANWIRKKGRKAVVIWELVWKVEQNVCCWGERESSFLLFFRSWKLQEEGPIFIYGKCTAATASASASVQHKGSLQHM